MQGKRNMDQRAGNRNSKKTKKFLTKKKLTKKFTLKKLKKNLVCSFNDNHK